MKFVPVKVWFTQIQIANSWLYCFALANYCVVGYSYRLIDASTIH